MNAILRILIWAFAIAGILLVAGDEVEIGALSFFEFVAWKLLGMALCVAAYGLWVVREKNLVEKLQGYIERRRIAKRGFSVCSFVIHLARKNRRAPAENGGAHA